MKKTAVILAFLWSVLMTSSDVLAVSAVPKKSLPSVAPTASATPTVKILTDEVDLTIPKEEVDNLNRLIKEQKNQGWVGFNILKVAMRNAVSKGVSMNTLLLLFLFPLVAGMVAFSRQVVGVSGFGMIVPSLLSIAFLSTGGVVGLILLTFVLSAAFFGRMLIKRVKVPYLPKLAILIWLVSLLVVVLLVLSPMVGLDRLMSVGIFPILIFLLLAETFVEAQITRSLGTSLAMTLETVVLALVAYKVMSWSVVQSMVVLYPEFSAMAILVIDVLIGRYKGLRLAEIWRFRKLLQK